MMRLFLALMGLSARDQGEEADKHRAERDIAMQAVQMKVDALQTGADRLTVESRRTEAAAAALLSRLKQDFPT